MSGKLCSGLPSEENNAQKCSFENAINKKLSIYAYNNVRIHM